MEYNKIISAIESATYKVKQFFNLNGIEYLSVVSTDKIRKAVDKYDLIITLFYMRQQWNQKIANTK